MLTLKVLVVVTALWGRLEFQAKRYLPWILLSQNSASPLDSETLLLDYANISLPAALRTSIRKRHFLVLGPLLTLLLLLVEIVLSTGVFIRLDAEVERGGVSGIVRDRFVLDDEGRFERTGGRDAYAVMLGIAKGDIRHPEGYTPGLAYQTFDFPGLAGDSSFRMEVDAVSVRPECDVGSVADPTSGQMNLTIGSSMCGQDIPVSLTSRNASMEEQYHFVYKDLEGVEGCPADEPLVLAGVFQMKSISNGELEHVNSAAVVCKVPFYSGRRDVIRRRDAKPTIRPTAEDDELVEQNLLDPIHYGLGYNGTFGTAVTGDSYLTDDLLPPFVLATHLASSSPPDVDAFLDGEKLSGMMDGFFTNFAPLAAHYNLREEDPNLSHGTSIAVEQRLRVVQGIAHAMTALFGVSVLLAAPLMLYVPRRGITPRCPNSVAGTAVLLVNSEDIFERLRGADTSSLQSISKRLQGSYYSVVEMGTVVRKFVIKRVPEEAPAAPNPPPDTRKRTPDGYNPWVLRPLSRIIGVLVTGAFAATLWGLVAASNNNQGLGPVSDPHHKSILWTCLPAAALVALGSYIKAVDFQTRLLAPFSALYNPNGFATGMMTTYTDELAPVTAYKAAMSKSWAVMLAKGTAVLAVLMPILVCRLYTAESVMTRTEVDVEQVEGFEGVADNVALVDVAATNASFPWVHGDLVLPKVEVPGDMRGATVEAKLPAVRAELTCKPLKPSDGDITAVDCELLDPEQSDRCGGETNDVFGHVATRCSSTSTGEEFSGFMHYIWGTCDGTVETDQAIISCEERVVEVEVETTLRGEALSISEAEEDTRTKRETDIRLSKRNAYNLQGKTDPWFDPFFGLLSRTTSFGPDSTVESVTSAIQSQHSLLRAQVLTASRKSSPASPHKGTKTEKTTRVVQHGVPTYLLATALTLAVAFSGASAIVAPASALPCSPGSVGAVAGMLAEWGMRIVPAGAEWMGDGELRRYFEGG